MSFCKTEQRIPRSSAFYRVAIYFRSLRLRKSFRSVRQHLSAGSKLASYLSELSSHRFPYFPRRTSFLRSESSAFSGRSFDNNRILEKLSDQILSPLWTRLFLITFIKYRSYRVPNSPLTFLRDYLIESSKHLT